MSEPVRILIVEDLPTDFDLAQREIRKAVNDCKFEKVETRKDFLEALGTFQPDLILSDYHLPSFDGMTALKLAQEHAPLTPLIIWTGTLSEDTAAECMKAGADNYILKENIRRLGPAVVHALEERRLRLERKQAEEALAASERRFRVLIENSNDGIVLSNADGTVQYASSSALRLMGDPPDSTVGTNPFTRIHPDDVDLARETLQKLLAEPGELQHMEWRVKHHDGSWRWVRVTTQNLLGNPAVGALVSNFRDITDRKQAEQALQNTEAKYRSLVEQLPAITYIVEFGESNNASYISPQVESLLGFSQEEWITSPDLWVQQLHPDDRQRVLAEFELRDSLAQPANIDYRLMTRDGHIRWFHDQSVLISDERGKPHYAHGLLFDITDRKLAEEVLRETETKYRTLVEQLPAVTYVDIVDSSIESGEFITRYISPQIESLLGYAPEEFYTEADLWARLIHPNDRERVLAGNADHYRTHRFYSDEYRMLTRKGREIWVRDEAIIVRGENGEPALSQGVVFDITERNRAEERLRDSEKRFRALIENSSDEISLLAADGALLYESPSANPTLGYRPGQFLGQDMFQLVHPEDLKRLESLFAHLVQVSGLSMRDQFRLRHSSGTWRWVEAVGTNLLAEPAVQAIVVNYHDITERRQAEERLQRNEQMLRLFVEHSPAAIAMLDRDMKYIVASRRYLADYRLGDQDLRGVSHYEVFPELPERWKEIHKRCLAGAVEKSNEDAFPRADGKMDWVRWEIRPWYEATNEIGGIILFSEVITERKQAEMERQTLLEIRQGLATTADLQEFLKLIHHSIGKLIYAENFFVVLYDKDNGLFEEIYSVDKYDLPAPPSRLEKSITSYVFRTGESVLLTQAMFNELVERGEVELVGTNSESWLGVPLKTPEGTIGVIAVQDYERPDRYSEQDKELLASIAGQVSLALERKQADSEIRRHLIELEALYENGLAVGRLLNPRDIGERIIETFSRYLSWHHVTIRLRRGESDELELVAFNLPNLEEDERAEAAQNFVAHINKVGQGMSGWVVHTGLPIRTGNVQSYHQYVDTFEGIKSGLYMPMKIGDLILGCISVESELPNAFTARDERLLATLANQAAVAFENARLYQTIQQELSERRRTEELLESERNSLAQRVAERTADLSRALRVKDEFLANMSHELRTPLNAILGLSESLDEQIAGPLNEKQQKYVTTIRESGHHLLSLINDILDLAKIEAGQITLDINKVNMNLVCEASLRMIKQLAQKKNQDVTFEIDEGFGLMWADERRLKQMIVNLLSNAVKFTPEHGKIGLEVRGDRDENRVTITVWDNGIGIREGDIPRLSQPFVQLDSGFAREATGTGLGLTLVTKMASMHGGSVSIASDFGKGSRFTITLPWEPALAVDTVERLRRTGKFPAIKPDAKNKPTILLVEDTQEVVLMLKDYLELTGYKIVTAQDGVDGITQAKLVHPDLILMDLQMPRMNGLEATAKLRSDPDFQHIPIIALTALAMSGDRERCLAAGMDEYISKPVNLKALVKIIQGCLPHKNETKPE